MSRELTFLDALREAIREEMKRDPTIFIMGEDVTGGYGNGDFGVTRGLIDEFGAGRVRDTPICENTLVLAGVGAAATGTRPIVEIMYSDFLALAMESIANVAAKFKYVHGAETKLPLLIRTVGGGGIRSGPCHSQSLEAWFVHTPGLRIVMPSSPRDVKGLFKTAIRGDSPTVFFEHKLLYRVKGEVPEEDYTIPFGVADVKHEGENLTILAVSLMVQRALEAASKLKEEDISVEVVDPRTLVPLDKKTILNSVRKTGRVLIVEEGPKTCGVGAELAAMIAEEGLEYLDAPPRRVANPDLPVPYSPPLEDYVIPSTDRIMSEARALLAS